MFSRISDAKSKHISVTLAGHLLHVEAFENPRTFPLVVFPSGQRTHLSEHFSTHWCQLEAMIDVKIM